MTKISNLTAPQTEQDLKDINLTPTRRKVIPMIALLKKRLEEKVKYEAVLKQGLQSAQSSVQVLQNQLESEVRSREQFEKEIQEVNSNIETLKESSRIRDVNKFNKQKRSIDWNFRSGSSDDAGTDRGQGRKADISLIEKRM